MNFHTKTSVCYHQHKHCADCSSSGCFLCKFIQLRSWVNSRFDELPIDIKPIVVVCHDWEKNFEEQPLKLDNIAKLCDRQDSSHMDIDENPVAIRCKFCV